MFQKGKSPEDLIIQQLIDAAAREDWETLDEQLVPSLSNFDQLLLARQILVCCQDTNQNIRDMCATVLAKLEISDQTLLGTILDKMMVMVRNDTEVFPTGRAALVLLKYKESKDCATVLREFVARVEVMGCRKELIENIPAIDELFRLFD